MGKDICYYFAHPRHNLHAQGTRTAFQCAERYHHKLTSRIKKGYTILCNLQPTWTCIIYYNKINFLFNSIGNSQRKRTTSCWHWLHCVRREMRYLGHKVFKNYYIFFASLEDSRRISHIWKEGLQLRTTQNKKMQHVVWSNFCQVINSCCFCTSQIIIKLNVEAPGTS